MSWNDLFRLWALATGGDPNSRQERLRNIEGAGVNQPEAIPDLRQDGSYWSGGKGVIKLRDSSDFIDLSSVTNRQSRYKEYDRLRMVPEIETATTVFADESCVIGDTKIATAQLGYVTIQELAQTKKPEELFLTYCYDFKKEDFTLGWAFHPRKVKTAETVQVALDNGKVFTCTPDHRVLTREGIWKAAGDLVFGDELMPFYRRSAEPHLSGLKTAQFARVYTLRDGWKTEREFIDEWRSGTWTDEKSATQYKISRMVASKLNSKQICKLLEADSHKVHNLLKSRGFSIKELRSLRSRFPDRRRVLGVAPAGDQDVYDLSVKDHENFATDTTIFHNCQVGENGHLFEIAVKNSEIREELEFMFFHPRMLNMDRKLWNVAKNLYIYGDYFFELIMDPENPKDGVIKVQTLPADSVYRIETIKGKLLEFQQSKDGPDYQSLARVEVTQASKADIQQATAIRFMPNSIVHMRIGDDRRMFYPYGVSLVEPARGPAHQLRLLEDALLVYRLSRAPERRVFYIDVGGLPPFKADMFMGRLKDQLRKKKTFNNRGNTGGASSPVEERWVAPSQDEDFWIPTRPGSNTRVETLPGASQLGEVDDALYFRNKLFIALNFPKNYMVQEDPQVTRVPISAIDVKFARLVERLQQSIADGLTEIAVRHLELRGYPEELYADLRIVMTRPSHYRELSESEVLEARINRALSLKGSGIFSDLDVMTRIMKIPLDEAKELVSRAMIQKLQEMKLSVMAANPQLMGVAVAAPSGTEMGTESGGPNPMLTGEENTPPEGTEGTPPESTPPSEEASPPKAEVRALPDPTEEEIRKYDLDIQDYSSGQDEEEVDEIEVGD